jgi:diguanylate cyclase (GGDEF)-like protein/PAS domain S-box-containing protein
VNVAEDDRLLLSRHVSQEAVLDALLPAHDGVYVKDRAGAYLMVNASGASYLGHSADSLVGKTDREVFPGELGERLWRSDQEIMEAGRARTLEEPVLLGGRLRTFLTTKAPLRDAAGAVVGLVGVSTDVTALRDVDEEVRRREVQLAEAQALTGVGSWEWDIASGRQSWSDETFRIVGLEPGGVEPGFETFLEYVHPDDRDRLAVEVAKAIEPGSPGSYELEHRILRPDGTERICVCRGRVSFDVDGAPLRMVGACLDVTDRRREEAELERRALRDPLTGLANRTLLLDRLRHAVELSRRRESRLALLFVDLDGFKTVNDRFGHEAGDRVLASAAERLRAAVRGSDTLARVGGDEFVVVCEDMRTESSALDTAERISAVLRAPFAVRDAELRIAASVGIALATAEHVTPEDLLRAADDAMYVAKRRGGDQIAHFTQS